MFKSASPWWLPLVGFVLLVGSVFVGNIGGNALNGASFFAGLMDGVAIVAFGVFIYAGTRSGSKQPAKRNHGAPRKRSAH